MVSIQKNVFVKKRDMKNLQFRTLLLCYKVYVTEKYIETEDATLKFPIFQSSDIVRRPQNLKKSPTCFDIYSVTSKQVGYFLQNFVAFSDNLNFI